MIDHHFLGIANLLARFSLNLATLSPLIHQLLISGKAWHWGQLQQTAFQKQVQLTSAQQPLQRIYQIISCLFRPTLLPLSLVQF